MEPFKFSILLLAALAIAKGCQEGCVYCDPQTQVCLACGDRYQLTLLGQCVPDTVANCRLYLSLHQCVRCLPTYQLINDKCQPDLSGCILNISSTRCARCSPELELVEGRCVGTLNCEDRSSPCQSCGSGFSLGNGVCLAKAQNCMIVNRQNGVCFQCQDNYNLVGYRCISKDIVAANCYLYDERGSCFFCKDGYSLADGECLLNNEALGQMTKGARGVASQASTTSSSASSNNSNQQYSAGISNNPPPANTSLSSFLNILNIQCSRFNKSLCVECYPSYYLNSQNICVQINPLCQSFNHTSKRCEACYGGYTLTSDFSCVVSPPQARDPRCRTFNGSQCKQCYAQFHLSNNVCVANNPLCREIFSNGSCKSCYEGYKLSEKTCVRTIKPEKDSFCIRYQDEICLTCVNGYFVQNSTGRCIPIDLNCLSSDDSGRCTSCLPNYMLLRGRCIVAINSCLAYADNGMCSLCTVGFFLAHGICYPKDITCSGYNAEGQCIGCITTYYLFKGKCIFPALGYDAFCTNYINSYCTECKEGTYLNNFMCLKIDIRCLDFDRNKARCLKCVKGFQPMGPECV